MADLRIPGPASPAATPARPLPPARAEAVRAAQRAFFDTALAGEAQAATTRTPAISAAAATPATAAVAAAAPVRVAIEPGAPTPTRLLRPGSLLDIKV